MNVNLKKDDLVEVIWVDACDTTEGEELKAAEVDVIQTTIGRYIGTVEVRGVGGIVIWNEKTETPTVSYRKHFIPLALIIGITSY